jgi:Zn-finger nucleic acid-binding protein
MRIVRKGKTEVDLCEEHGVWLDRGELEAIMRRQRIGNATRIQLAEERGRESGKLMAYWLGELAFLFDKRTTTSRRRRP